MTSNHKKVLLISIYEMLVLLTIIHTTTQFIPSSVPLRYRVPFRNIPRANVWYLDTTDAEKHSGPRPAMIISSDALRNNVRNTYHKVENNRY